MKKLNPRIKNFLILFPLFLIMVLFYLTFRPIMNVDMDDCYKLTGKVKYVKAIKGINDIVFYLDNSNKQFYINRGLEAGLTKASLDTLKGKEITIYPVDHWTLLDRKKKNQHVARVEVDGTILYSEF